MEIDNKKQMEMTLITNDHYGGSDKQNQMVVKMIKAETIKFDKIHCRANIFQNLVLFVVGVSYLLYGLVKWTNSTTSPLTKYHDESIESYPLPTTITCVDYKDDDVFFDVEYFAYYDK